MSYTRSPIYTWVGGGCADTCEDDECAATGHGIMNLWSREVNPDGPDEDFPSKVQIRMDLFDQIVVCRWAELVKANLLEAAIAEALDPGTSIVLGNVGVIDLAEMRGKISRWGALWGTELSENLNLWIDMFYRPEEAEQFREGLHDARVRSNLLSALLDGGDRSAKEIARSSRRLVRRLSSMTLRTFQSRFARNVMRCVASARSVTRSSTGWRRTTLRPQRAAGSLHPTG